MKSAKISFFVVVGWALAWTPFTIVSLLGIFGAYSYLTPAACHFPAIFAKTASVYNPISNIEKKLLLLAQFNSRYNSTTVSLQYMPSTVRPIV